MTGMDVYAGSHGQPLRDWIAQREAHIWARMKRETNEAALRQMQGALQELDRLGAAARGEDPADVPPQPGG